MITKYTTEELEKAMTDIGTEEAYQQYKNNGGSTELQYFMPQWKSLIQRMIDGYPNTMGLAIAEEKYKRKNPFWDPRD